MNKKRYSLDPPEIKDYLVKGERFTKWSEDSNKTSPVTMKMDSKGYYVYWTNQSKETTFLDVATIRDTRTGKYAKLPKHPKVRNVFNMDFPDSNHLAKTLTIVTGPDMVDLTFHNFFASKEKVTQNWAADILAIAYNPARNNACRQVFLDKIYVRLSLHTNKDGKIPVKNIYKMFPADKKRVESALSAAHLPKGKYDTMKPDVFSETAFKTFLTNLCPRPEIDEIFTSYSSGSKPYMTKDNFTKFLNEKQRDSRLNEELFPRLRPDQIKALIEKYEPNTSNANKGQVSREGLLFYLMGPETSVIILDHLALCHEMTKPIPHYFIKSSHNTYLTAGQLSGVSSPEMYRQCLLSGCRCLELDCWKGKPPEEDPHITHGFTMTTQIFFKDVIEAIAESAFKTSPYPVILSFENHVDSVKQQEKMANYCKTIFGDALLTEPLEKYPLKPGQQIPSPSELMGKILIKNKKGSHGNQNESKKPPAQTSDQSTAPATSDTAPATSETAPPTSETAPPVSTQDPNTPSHDPETPAPTTQENQEADVTAEDNEEQEDTEEQDEEKMKSSDEGTAGQEVTAYEAMSSIVNYIQPCKFVSFDNARKKNKSYNISSFVETRGEAMISKSAVEFVEYNKRQMSRIYPKGTRIDSSNYSPQPFWNAGCQMVALNYQTMDFPMQLNMALFEYNGRSGYLLKHDVMRRNDKKFDPFCDRIDTIVANTLTIKIYSGQFLSDKNVKTGVEVEVIGLPGDPKKKYRTKWSTTPNAINPMWNEEPFVFEKVLLPEMAALRLVVHEENGKFLGHRILPVDAIQSGFQHICLRSESNMALTLPALFVFIEVKDYIPAAFADFTDALFNPTKGEEKTTKNPKPSSSDYISPYEMPIVVQTPAENAEAQNSTASAAESDNAVATIPEEKADVTADTPDSVPPPEDSAAQAETQSADTTNDVPDGEGDSTTDATQPIEDPPQSSDAAEDPTTVEVGPTPEAEAEPAVDVDSTPDTENTTLTAEQAEPLSEEPQADPEALNGEPEEGEPSPEPEPSSDETLGTDVANNPEMDSAAVEEGKEANPAAAAAAAVGVAAAVPCELSVPACSDDSPQPPSDGEPSTVTCEELTQHKRYLKTTKHQEKDVKELDRRFQKKSEDLLHKHSEAFKALKKKASLKKKESCSDSTDSGIKRERVQEQKEKLQAELQALWEEHHDHVKRRREQHATERLTKLLEMATERHSSEMRTLESETKEAKKKSFKKCSSDKAKMKRSMSIDALEESPQPDAVIPDYSPQQEALMKKQAVTIEEIKALANQLNQEALKEHEQKMRSLPGEVKEAVNACVGAHFPEQVDQSGEEKKEVEGVGVYGDVFLG